MKQGLTKREKILIFSAVLIVLIYLAFQFGFIPLSSYYTDALTERDHLSEEKATIENNIANKSSISEANKNANRKFDEIIKD